MMRTRKALVAGCAAVALVGGGGVAVAAAAGSASPAATTTPSAAPTTAAAAQGAAAARPKPGRDGEKGGGLGRLKGIEHAEWVTKDTAGVFVTHDAMRGAVTTVSPTSVTVKAADGTSLTFAVTTDTRVRVRTASGTGAKAAVADLRTGEQVLVAGVRQPALTARHIVASPG